MNLTKPTAIHSTTANSQTNCGGLTSLTSNLQNDQKGVSVGYGQDATKKEWFVIRATRNRATVIYRTLVAMDDPQIEPYLPMRKRKTLVTEDFNNPYETIIEEPLDKTLLFVKCTELCFKNLLKKGIDGLTPLYDHFRKTEFGRNPYLFVPERQMDSFRTIIEAECDDIIIRPADFTLKPGDLVEVIDGPFKGVRGTVMKYKHQRRVFVKLDGITVVSTGYIHRNLLKIVEEY